jgi:peptidoglycan/LPS O-acetylase OafA/YrhL
MLGERPTTDFSRPLHSIRGIAAIVVVLAHTLIYPSKLDPSLNLYQDFANGEAAVALFFVLSGLVLSLSLRRSYYGLRSYAAYLTRRAFRLLPLLFATAIIGSVCIKVFGQSSYAPFQEIGPLDLAHFIAGLVGYSIRSNPPSWSIYVELMISALLPLMWLAYETRYRAITILVIVGLSAIDLGLQHRWNFYLINFLAGVAIVHQPLRVQFSKWSWVLFVAVVLIFYFDRPIARAAGYEGSFADNQWINFADVFLITPILAIVFYRADAFKWLQGNFGYYLGEMSYGIYLNHWFVIWAVNNATLFLWSQATAQPKLLLGISATLTLPITVALAWIMHRWIELPGMDVGKTVAAKIGRRRTAEARAP